MIRFALDGGPCTIGLCYGYTERERAAHIPGRAIDPRSNWINRTKALGDPEPDWLPMSKAPHDGQVVTLKRRTHPNTKRPHVTGKWIDGKRPYWRLDNGQLVDDDALVGWLPR